MREHKTYHRAGILHERRTQKDAGPGRAWVRSFGDDARFVPEVDDAPV